MHPGPVALVQVQDQGDGGWVDVDIAVVDERIRLVVQGERIVGSEGIWPPGSIAQVVRLLEKACAGDYVPEEPVRAAPGDLWAWVSTAQGKVGFSVMAGGGDSELVLARDDAAVLTDGLRAAVRKALKWNLGDMLLRMPDGWNVRLDELKPSDHGDGRLSITGEESTWARELELRELRTWARFPQKGEVYEALEETPVDFLVHWRAPMTSGGSGVVPRGTRVRIDDTNPESVAAGALPLDYESIERRLVSEQDRESPKYGGYSLSLRTSLLNRAFRLVEAPQRDAMRETHRSRES